MPVLIMAENWFALFTLANLGAYEVIEISSIEFAERIRVSQQTASRRLKELEKLGYISRVISHKGQSIRITDQGFEMLHKIYLLLHDIFDKKPQELVIEGAVFSGFGEGAYYVTKEGYRKQFIEKLGFDPYPGTLNIKLKSDYDMKTKAELATYPAIEINSFQNDTRTYGPVKCYPVILNNKEKGALIVALRSHYDTSVLEIIAPLCLRKRLKLKDGHKVKVEILIPL